MPEAKEEIKAPLVLYTEKSCIEFLKKKKKTNLNESIIFYLESFERVREITMEALDDNKI